MKAWELQRMTVCAQNLGDRRDAFEKHRDLAADAYRVETGESPAPMTWKQCSTCTLYPDISSQSTSLR